MIKAVFLDIDGTMVPFGEKEIRPSLIDAFDRLHEAGIKVIVASGRSRLLIKNLRDYPFDGYITVNGGLAVMDGKVLCSEPIDRQVAIDLARRIEETGVATTVFTADSLGINHETETTRMAFELIHLFKFPQIPLIRTAEEKDIYEFTIFINEETRLKHFGDMADILSWERWHPEFLDVMSTKASKGDAMVRMAEYMGLKPEEVMAFGDGGNDVSMVRMAGTGVAMGNGNDSVKAVADYIAPPADEDGVVATLQYFGLINR